MIEKRYRLNLFAYYFSFVFLYLILAFLAIGVAMGYEDGTYTPNGEIGYQIALGFYYFLKLPLGPLLILLTGEEGFSLLSILINPILIGWILLKTVTKKYRDFGHYILRINYGIAAMIIFLVLVYALYAYIRYDANQSFTL